MITYTHGITLQTQRIITKNDIITLCKSLNDQINYHNLCEFQPEGISGGGILFKFRDNSENKWYKSVRLSANKWYFINDNVLSEWSENNDIIYNKNTTFTLFLKSFDGAPLFTIDELKIWENCFNKIGCVKVGKYPTKKSLISE